MTVGPSILDSSQTPSGTSDSKKLADAARQFEALLIGQLLRSARDPDEEGPMEDQGGTGSALLDMGEQQFAQALAASGGLGIAKMVITGLESHANR